MANNGEFLEFGADKAYADILKLVGGFETIAKSIKDVNANFKSLKTPSVANDASAKLIADYDKQKKAIVDLQLKLEKLSQMQTQTSIKNAQLKLKEIQVLEKEEAAILKALAAEDRANAKKASNAEKSRLILERKEAADKKAADAAIRNVERVEARKAKEYAKFEKDFAKYEAAIEKEASVYNKIQAKINELTPAYNNLAAKRELGVKLSKDEIRQLDFLTGKLNGYQNILKKVDSTIGKHQREVGNYAKANSNLSNSIGQISRELPNFGQSFSIGVLSLTNNIGALIDGIKQVKLENKELASQGQATKSVFSQILSSLLSWQTALFIGIGIFSAYSKEIGTFFDRLIHGRDVLSEVYKIQDEFNKKRLESSARTKQDVDNLREYINIAKNSNKAFSPDEVLVAFQKLREAGKYYFKDLQDNEVFTKKGTSAVIAFSKALEQEANAKDLLSANEGTNKRINELQAEIDARKNYRRKQLEIFKEEENDEEKRIQRLDALRSDERARRKRRDKEDDDLLSSGSEVNVNGVKFETYNDIQSQVEALRKEELSQRAKINTAVEKSILLDYKEVKSKKDLADSYFKYIDALNRDGFELNKFRAEQEIEELRKVAENEKSTFEGRISAYGEMLKKRQDLLKLELDFELKELNQAKQKEIFDANKDYEQNKDKFKNEKAVLLRIEADHAKELEIINRNYRNRTLLKQEQFNAEYLKIVEDTARTEIEINNKRIEVLNKANDIVMVRESAMFKRVAENEKLSVDVRQQAFRAQLEIERKRLDLAEMREKSENPNNIEEITEKYKSLRGELELLESPYQKTAKAAREMFEQMAKGLRDNIFSDAGLSSVQQFFDNTFKNALKAFDLIEDKAEGMRKKTAYAFVQIAEAAQEAFALMAQFGEENYDQTYARLEQQRDVALAFEGNTVASREEINRQYDERRKQIQRQQAEAQKRNAIFNIAIDTAQAAIATLAQTPLPAGLPLLLATLAFGGIQAGLVASQPIPEFKDGGIHKGGLMKVNDAPGGVFREAVTLPGGKTFIPEGRNVIMDAPAGTKIKKATDTQRDFGDALTRILAGNGIGMYSDTFTSPAFKQSGTRDIDYAKLAAAYPKPVAANVENTELHLNENGLQKFIKRDGANIQIMNGRFRGKTNIV